MEIGGVTNIQRLQKCIKCENGVQHFCQGCQKSLCRDCINDHLTEELNIQHSIILYRNRVSIFSFPSCSLHPNYKLDTFCYQCCTPVCLICWECSHDNHTFGHMKEFVVKKKKKLLQEMKIIENCVKEYENENATIEKTYQEKTENFRALRKSAEVNEKDLIEEIQDLFLRYRKSINDQEKEIRLQREKREKFLSDAVSAVKILNSIIQSDDQSILTKIVQCKITPKIYQQVLKCTRETISRCAAPVVIFGDSLQLVQELNDARYSQLSLQSMNNAEAIDSEESYLMDKAIVIGFIHTGKENLFRFVRRDSYIYICHYFTLEIYSLPLNQTSSASVCEKVSCSCQPESLVIDKDKILYSSAMEGSTINMIANDGTSIEIVRFPGWIFHGICQTCDKKLLVCMANPEMEESKIIRYNITDSRTEQEIQYADDNQPLFQFGDLFLFVAENKNGDVCVSDPNAYAIVVVNQNGNFRFRYAERNLELFGKTHFRPDQIVTDSLCNIIVTDYFNNRIHIISQDGMYLKCIDNCELDMPISLDLDENGNLLVGMFFSGVIKVIKYIK
ncbi:uncharacterized protein LOC134279754 [Saccostrea cucullata]|uniref:uncharacterized protein LOC134279754 n=1 Tax=Saccostrea cuccullata TaxID=36930 RepID=UPI002ED4134E